MKTFFYEDEKEVVNKFRDPRLRSALAPIIIFVYNRTEKIKKCIEALSSNYLANDADLFVISDGPRAEHVSEVNIIRSYLADVSGFRSVNVLARQSNWGATKSTSSAEHLIGNLYGRFIAMEDDNIVTKNFLDYMNQALNFYQDDPRIFSICGYKAPFSLPGAYSHDVWFSPWHNAWTYATWYDRWSQVNLENNDFSGAFKSREARKRLRSFGLFMYDAAWLDWKGFARANDARICMYMFQNKMVTVAPSVSLVFNDGQDGKGLHAKKTNRFNAIIANGRKRRFDFLKFDRIDSKIISLFVEFMDRSIFHQALRYLGLTRLKYIVRNFLSKLRSAF